MIEADVEVSAEIVDRLRTTAAVALQHQRVEPPAALTVLLTSDITLQQLNKTFRDIDKVTDVLSFEDGEAPAHGLPVNLGDIAISVAQAQRQADAGGHLLSAELQLLTVHGVLHLLGYDHATPAQQADMWREQAAILTQLQAPLTVPKL